MWFILSIALSSVIFAQTKGGSMTQQFIVENDLEILASDKGLALAYKGKQLTVNYPDTPSLLAEIEKSGDAIRIAKLVEVPSDDTLCRYLSALDGTISKLDIAAVDNPKMLDRLASPEDIAKSIEWLKENNPGDLVLEMILSIKQTIDNNQAHRDAIEHYRKLALEAPCRIGLPLGAKVRLRKDWDVPSHYGLDPAIKWGRVLRPAAGSIGFVTGTAFGQDEASIVVAFADKFKETNGEIFTPLVDNGISKVVQIEDLEVLEWALLPNDDLNFNPDAKATHAEVYSDEESAPAVVLEVDGRVIMIYADGNPLDEGVRFHKNIDEIEDLQPLSESHGIRP